MKPKDDLLRVRYSSSTYVARWRGKKASSTEGMVGAAQAVAHKVLGKDALYHLVLIMGGDEWSRTYRVDTQVDAAAFAAVAELRPHLAHAADPDRFWALYSERFPGHTREQMEQLLRETEDEAAAPQSETSTGIDGHRLNTKGAAQ